MRLLLVALVCVGCGGPHVAPAQACHTSDQCTQPDLPFCVDGACRACDGTSGCTQAAPVCTAGEWTCGPCTTDGDCGAFAAAGHCAADGTCVGCIDATQCANPTPTCDAQSHACRGCAVDDDCASAVCDRDGGACADPSFVLYVAPTGGDTAACTQADPCSIVHAIAISDGTHTLIKLAPGSYTAEATVATKTLTFYGFGATWHTPAGATYAIHVAAAANVTIRGVAFQSDGAGAVDCSIQSGTRPTLALDRVTADSVSESSSPLVNAIRCTGTVTRSTLVWHSNVFQVVGAFAQSELTFRRVWFQGGNGLGAFSSSRIHVVNSVWKDVTGSDGALMGDSTAGGDVSLSTLIDSPVHCGGDMISAPTWNWSSNILYGSGTADVADGFACTYHFNIMVPQGAAPVGANNLRDKDPRFVDVAHGDFHLTATSPAKDGADPAMTVTEDYDGLARPDGAHDDCGAFEYRP